MDISLTCIDYPHCRGVELLLTHNSKQCAYHKDMKK